jgi:hypothetical protein
MRQIRTFTLTAMTHKHAVWTACRTAFVGANCAGGVLRAEPPFGAAARIKFESSRAAQIRSF